MDDKQERVESARVNEKLLAALKDALKLIDLAVPFEGPVTRMARSAIAAAEAAQPVSASYPCWSCNKPVTIDQRSEADGNCPHCHAELDEDDWPTDITDQSLKLLRDFAVKFGKDNADEGLLEFYARKHYEQGVADADQQPAIAAAEAQQADQQGEHNMTDIRCECCGYLTYQREHMGCIRAATEMAQQSEPVALIMCDGKSYDFMVTVEGQKRIPDTGEFIHLYAAQPPSQQQAEPVAAQCRFEGEEEWKPCTVAHHLLVQAHPKEWPHYETRALYAQPPAVAVPDAAVGKLRILLAACNRIEAEAEEFESQDGFEVAIAIDYWLEFIDALEDARAMLAAAQKGGA